MVRWRGRFRGLWRRRLSPATIKLVAWLDAAIGHFTRNKKKKRRERERHVTALLFRVSLRHAAVQLSSRFASLGSEEKVNAAWIWLQLALFRGVTLHFCITFLLVPALVHFTCFLWEFFTRFFLCDL